VFTVTKLFYIFPDFLTLLHPDFSFFPQATGTLLNYMERTVIKSSVRAWVIVLGLGLDSGLG
jgi:hypothetical protein